MSSVHTHPVLQVEQLTTEVHSQSQWFPVVRDATLTIEAGQTMGLVGESGSGKSMLAMSILGLLPPETSRLAGGRIMFQGDNLTTLPSSQRRNILGNKLSVVFQDPLTSLNPVFTIGNQLVEMIRRHQTVTRGEARNKAIDLLGSVHIPDPEKRFTSYPHELSGGQRQRVAIAMAIANEPDLLICDEPTTALDVTIQAEILDLFQSLQKRMGMAMLFITHDLGVAREICDDISVMYASRIVESGTAERVLEDPQHPYTRQLLQCVPRLGNPQSLIPIQGFPPQLNQLPPGCAFADRCDIADELCREGTIQEREAEGRRVVCRKPGEQP